MRTRLRKEIEQLDKVIASSQRQLGSEAFTSKAPPHVIEGIRTKLADYEAQRAKSQQALATLGS
jgi:valyl-tRNA synthetase